MGLDSSADYEVSVNGAGSQPVPSEDVLVVSGRSLTLEYTLEPAGTQIQEIVVAGSTVRMVDTKSAMVGTDVTLDITDSRFWGVVPEENIIGTVKLLLLLTAQERSFLTSFGHMLD